jgi:FkbM family methyltransferase
MQKMAEHICPWWLGYWLVNPFRKFIHDPVAILSPYVKEGMQVMDIGSGMGYFSLPLAKMVGEKGRVHCVDVQPQMLKRLEKRALKKGLRQRLLLHLVSTKRLDMHEYRGQIDFVLAFAVVHEVPDKEAFLKTLYSMLKRQGLFLFAEPKKRTTQTYFTSALDLCRHLGFSVIKNPEINNSFAALLQK